jgi:glutaredoxin
MMLPITLYTTPGCSACAALKRYLQHKGLSFEEKDISQDRAALAEMQRHAGVRIAPVTVIGEHAFYGDFERQKPQIDAVLKVLEERK